MLTKQDLSQISKVVDGVVEKQFEPVKKDVSGLKENVSDLERVALSNTKKLDKIQKNLNLVINYFDKNFLELQARVARIEKKLGIKPLSL